MEVKALILDIFLTGRELQEMDLAQTLQQPADELPEHREVKQSEVANNYTISSTTPKELPKVFESTRFVKGSDISSNLQDYLGMFLSYLMDDQLVGFDKILFHPESKKINSELLPLRRSVYSAESDLEKFFFKTDNDREYNLMSDWEYFLLRALKNSQKMLINQRIKVYLRCFEKETKSEKFCYEIKSLDFLSGLKKESSHVTPQAEAHQEISAQPVSFEVVCHKHKEGNKELGEIQIRALGVSEKKDKALFKNFTFNIESRVISFQQRNKELDHFQQFLTGQQIHGHLAIHETIEKIRKKAAETGARVDVLPKTKKLVLGEFHPRLEIVSEGRMSVSFLHEQKGKELVSHNLFGWAKTIEKCLKEGFQALYSDYEMNVLNVGARRIQDMAVLKSNGIYMYFIYEMGKHMYAAAFEKKVPEKTEFLDSLYKKMGALAFNNSLTRVTEEASLKHMCSQKMLAPLEEHIDWLFKKAVEEPIAVYTADGETQFDKANVFFFVFLNCLIQQIMVATQGECFKKQRAKFALYKPKGKISYTEEEAAEASDLTVATEATSAPVAAVEPVTAPEEIHHNQYPMFVTDQLDSSKAEGIHFFDLYSLAIRKNYNFGALFELRNHHWKISYNGRPVEALRGDEFKAEINLGEAPEAIERNKEQDAAPKELPADGKPSKIDWFELHPKFFLRGQEIDLEMAMALTGGGLVEFGGQYYLLDDHQLPSVKALEKFWQRLITKEGIKGKRDKKKNIFYVAKNQALDLLALRASGVKISGGKDWNDVCEFYDTLGGESRNPQIPTTLKGELKPYQRTGLLWLQDIYKLRLGGILADDMGLGKTFQALAFLENLRLQKELGHTLIIVPTTLTYTWQYEAQKFTPDLPILTFEGKSRAAADDFLFKNEHAVMLCSYGLFVEHQEFFSKNNWNIHIYDEAQNLKNIVAKRTTAARKVNSKFKLCLTGTPLENHLGELFSLLDLTVPGCLGEYSDFRKMFLGQTIEKMDMSFLRLKIKPLVLRRTKSQILKELPEKMESVMRIPFEEKQKSIYRDVALSWNQKVKDSINQVGESRSQLIMLTALLRLRQVCSDPGALPGVKYTETPPKVSLLIDSVAEIVDSGESVIVFTQFLQTLSRLEGRLRKDNIPVYVLTGNTTPPNRQKLLQAFNDHQGGAVLLMTLKTGGVGLNLTKASYVFHLEPWWNPAVENQATDRVHRIGQLRSVQVYRYLMEESVEEKIELLKHRKSAQFKAVFDDVENETDLSNQGLQLSKDDFDYLLS